MRTRLLPLFLFFSLQAAAVAAPLAVTPGTILAPADQQALVERFAPIVRLHGDERYLPMSLATYFARLADSKDEDFFTSSRGAFLAGQVQAVMAHVSADGQWLQYWFFYPKNGCQGLRLAYVDGGVLAPPVVDPRESVLELCDLAIHEGDWEHLTLRLRPDRQELAAVFFSQHNGGSWLPASAVETVSGRVVAYSALNSHANYPHADGFHPQATVAGDVLRLALGWIGGIRWLQVGDIVSVPTGNGVGEQRVVPGLTWDTRAGLTVWESLADDPPVYSGYTGGWGLPVDGTRVQPIETQKSGLPPLLAWTVQHVAGLLIGVVPQLKEKSAGTPPPSPWGRPNWRDFDAPANQPGVGYARGAAVGGDSGDVFDDEQSLSTTEPEVIQRLSLRSGERLDALCMQSHGRTRCHGGDGGQPTQLLLTPGEYLQSATVAVGIDPGGDTPKPREQIVAIRLRTSRGRELSGGTFNDQLRTFHAPEGMQISGWAGRSANEVTALRPIYGRCGACGAKTD